MRAIWNDVVVAESDDTVIVEGNHYFPPESLKTDYFVASEHHTTCGWKGVASYYSLAVGGKVNRDAAWFYPEPKDAASHVRGRVAFWRGVQIVA